MSSRLAPDELARLTAARQRAQRAEIELRAARADLDLLLLNLQEAYGLGPGDKLTPDGAIVRQASDRATVEVADGRTV